MPPTYDLTEEQITPAYDEVLSAYEVVWKALKAGDVERVMPLFEERSREGDQAFYLQPGTTQRKLRAALQAAIEDPELELAEIRPKKGFWTYDVSPSGRLVRLVCGDRANAVIRFENKESRGYRTEFPIAFRKSAGKYIITR